VIDTALNQDWGQTGRRTKAGPTNANTLLSPARDTIDQRELIEMETDDLLSLGPPIV